MENSAPLQLGLFDGEQRTPRKDAPGDSFGCCSRYRQCSDAGICLIPDADYSANCSYRAALESGHVFYGKSADYYRPELYRTYCERYRALSPSRAGCLRSVLYEFFVRKRCAVSVMARLPDASDCSALDRAGFFRLKENPGKVLRLCTDAAIVDACGDLIGAANEWAKASCPAEKWEKRRPRRKGLPGIKILKDELTQWILENSPETAARLSRDIYFIEVDLDTRSELEEFYFDFLDSADPPPPLDDCADDPRFLAARSC